MHFFVNFLNNLFIDCFYLPLAIFSRLFDTYLAQYVSYSSSVNLGIFLMNVSWFLTLVFLRSIVKILFPPSYADRQRELQELNRRAGGRRSQDGMKQKTDRFNV